MDSPFVGRGAELDALLAAVEECANGAGRAVVLVGEPGIGKTRLADELSRRAAERGFAVAWGRSWEDEGTPAYFPFAQALRALADVPKLAARFGGDELAAIFAGAARARTEADRSAPFRVLDAATEALRAASTDMPILLVLDDVHTADAATLRLATFIARGLRGARVLLCVTSRDPTVHARPEVRPALAALSRDALTLPLGRLSRAALEEWIAKSAPAMAAELDALYSASEGNPLFVSELCAAALRGRRIGDAGISSGIRAAIGAHLGALSERTLAVLEAASVLGRDFHVPTALALTSIDVDTGRAAIAEAVELAVIASQPSDRARFGHILLRDELYARIEPARRRELHRAAARLCAREPAVAAQHWIACASDADMTEAAEAVLRAMNDAIARHAFDDGAELGARALSALGPRLSRRDACRIHIAHGEALNLAGETARSHDICERAVETAMELGDVELTTRAALAFGLDARFGDRDEKLIAILNAALAVMPEEDSALRTRLEARLVAALLPAPAAEHDAVMERSRLALEMARRVNDESALLTCLCLRATTLPDVLRTRERFELNTETIALAQRHGEIPRIAGLLSWQVTTVLELGDPEGAAREAAKAQRLLAGFSPVAYGWRVPLMFARLASFAGRFDEAMKHYEEAVALARRSPVPLAMIESTVFLTSHHYARGDAEGYAARAEEIERVHGVHGGWALFGSIHHAILGREEPTRAALERARRLELRAQPGVGSLGWPCAKMGFADLAPTFYDVVSRDMAMGPILLGPGGTIMGPRALLAGRLAVLMGRLEEAEHYFEAALDFATRVGARPFIAQTELDWGELLASRGEDGARARLEKAEALARELGMNVVATRAADAAAAIAKKRAPEKTDRAEKGGAPARSRAAASSPTIDPLALTRDGETWTIAAQGRSVVLRDTKGLVYLQALAQEPHREIHVLALVGSEERGDAGPMLDDKAKRAYRERVDALREEIEDATEANDAGRRSRAEAELSALAKELARAVGMGGRDRVAASTSERARINVQRRLKDVIRRVGEQDEILGKHLDMSVRTGVFCMYAPTFARD
jgi:tetratricopeptide (TPR) repeat protein